MKNCDLTDILTDEDRRGRLVYGKKMLVSHRNYDLWNEETDGFNVKNIEKFYKIFINNMKVAARVFETRWVYPNQLLPTTKGLIWDWTSEEEKLRTAQDILEYGVYFPIFTLDKGLLHNQIMSEKEKEKLAAKQLYNSYNGNHRIDAIQYLVKTKKWGKDKKILIYIIPSYCQKSCTGFKYEPIDDSKECGLKKWKLSQVIEMVHLDKVEHEMKVFNWRYKKEIEEGISQVKVDNYNTAFRIMLEIQNVLEPVLARYYQLYGKLPESIIRDNRIFNHEPIWKKEVKERFL